MSEPDNTRNNVARWILLCSGILIGVLAAIAIWRSDDPGTAQSIFNMVLPVASSWVGTVLAFYFGRENFEAANQQVRQLIERLSPEERAKARVPQLMRSLSQTVHFKHPAGKGDADVDIKTLRAKLVGDVTRIPVVSSIDAPLYMLHGSTFDRYLADGGKEADTLAVMVAADKAKSLEYGPGKGFIVVSEAATIGDAKQLMEKTQGCQDIFVTKSGTDKEALLGWISNTRLSKYLQS